MAGLRWSVIDLDAKTMRITETRIVDSSTSKAAISTPKTGTSRRPILLDDRLIAELKAHKARQARERLAAGTAWEETDYVFVDELGRPYRPEMLSRNFTKLSVKAGLRRIRLHDARHTAASIMLASGENPKVVAEMLGHASVVTTLDTYQHVLPGMAEEAGARLTQLLAGS